MAISWPLLFLVAKGSRLASPYKLASRNHGLLSERQNVPCFWCLMRSSTLPSRHATAWQALKSGRAAAAASQPNKELGPQSCLVCAAACHLLTTCHVARHGKLPLHCWFLSSSSLKACSALPYTAWGSSDSSVNKLPTPALHRKWLHAKHVDFMQWVSSFASCDLGSSSSGVMCLGNY